ncbi:hypothetical protein B0E52_16225 [Rhodanobacter sp. C06]|uniref:hypothetical protein n=1 Tax=Rhodanobacter sp. C06 TaxID=1945854 RepID=UPI000986A132|nr:hypothetical protein [Rhodanobacter sp. C06]OOG36963.1 hypothetical protein B0E52_16225 [Rhodanobacter sp. C06]
MKQNRSLVALSLLILSGWGVAAYAQAPVAAAHSAQNVQATSQLSFPSFQSLDTHHRGYLNRSDIPDNVASLRPLRMHFKDYATLISGRLSPYNYNNYILNQTGNKNRVFARTARH